MEETEHSAASSKRLKLPDGIAQIEHLAQLRSNLEIWTERAANAVWGFRRERDGSFWKDSKAANDAKEKRGTPPHITSTARAYIALHYADRVMGGTPPERGWVQAFKKFVASRHMTITSQSDQRWRFEQDATASDDKPGEVNTFDVAHLADFIQVADYVGRFNSDKAVPVVLAKRAQAEAGQDQPGKAAEQESDLIRRAVVDHLNFALRSATIAGNEEAPNSGEVRFDERAVSAHYFATLHTLRALHALGEPVPKNIGQIVEGAKAFAIEQCFYFQRGTRHRQDPVRLAFAGSIYAIYGEHVDKDLCLAIVDALHSAQQENGNWPATHPIFREKNRPWHIASHEVALCLAWLYFQPKMPDAARPTLVTMMRRYLLDAVAPTFFSAPKHQSQEIEGRLLFDGWQDDHTVGTETTVGWATAIICHFLANFSAVLDDWMNRRVIEELGLELATEGYLIDDVVGKPAIRWQRGYGTSPDQQVASVDPRRTLGEVWPDLPPHGWARRRPEPESIARKIYERWTDPSMENVISKRLASEVILPILASASQRPISDRHAGLMPGKPGTRKTSLVARISNAVDWPMIKVPASLIFADGFDRMEAKANAVFGMLNHLRRCVIFFDEFEEFFVSRGLEREKRSEADASTYKLRTIAAFTTSAMLPRLQDLHDQHWCLIFLATNLLDSMDAAIKRGGRFDFQIEVNHPTAERLLEYISSMSDDAVRRVGLHSDAELRKVVTNAVKKAIQDLAGGKSDREIRFNWIEQLLRMRPTTDDEKAFNDSIQEKLKSMIESPEPDAPPRIEAL